MASILDRFKSLINKNAQQTAQQYNNAIYNWLGDSIVWNNENDDSYINEGYRKNSTIYALINLISKGSDNNSVSSLRKDKRNTIIKGIRR